MRESPAAAVTGAFSYTGSAVARSLLSRGLAVRTLTNRRAPINDPGGSVDIYPLQFDDPKQLVDSMRGTQVLINTYWVRYPSVGVSFDRAVENTRILLQAAVEAGVQRIVHVSVSNPSLDSPLGCYRGKAQAEAIVRSMPISHAIVRPTLVVGSHDILVNNIAWFLRRFPFFAMPGSGNYHLQPVTLDDVGEIIADAALSSGDITIDAAGPDVLSFEQFVLAIGAAIGHPARIIRLPPGLALQLIRPAGFWVREIILSREELDGLMSELLLSHEPPLGKQSVLSWLSEHGGELGLTYTSELARHASRRAKG